MPFTMAEDGSSPAVPKSPFDKNDNEGVVAGDQIDEPLSNEQTKPSTGDDCDDIDKKKDVVDEQIKESKSDEQARESLSPIDDDGSTGNEDKDDTPKESAQLDSAGEKISTEGKEITEVDTGEISETECKETEKPPPTKDASTIVSEKSFGKSIEESTTVTSSPEAGMQDLVDLILEKKSGERISARNTPVAAGDLNGEDHSLLKQCGTDTTESRDATSITQSAASTQYTNDENSNNDLAAMIDAAPLAKVVWVRGSSSMQASHHDDPEVGQRFLEAVCVEDQNVVEAKIVVLEDIEYSRDRRSWLIRYGIIAAIVLLIAIVILSIVLSTRQGKAADPSKDPSTENVFENENAQKLIRIVAPLSGEEVFNDESPEFSIPHVKALGWLANDEFLSYDDPSIEWKVRQRYVLALLSTSTTGWIWHDSYFFMSEFDECNWSFTSSAGVDEHDPFSDRSLFTAHGVICNDEGRVERILLRWNGLVGTLPHEISEFSSSLAELNFDGGSISGQIPKSFEQLKKLEKLSLQDNCFTGTIPDFSKLRNLHTILLGNNNGLSGSLNDFCIGTERVGNMRNLYADCGNAIECDCCGCCDPDTFECCSEERGCFNSLNMKNGPEDTHIMAFDKLCLSKESKLWSMQECPCYIYNPPGSSTRECTTDCDAEGAIASKLWSMQECPCYIYNPPGSSTKECTTDCDAEGAIASSGFLQP